MSSMFESMRKQLTYVLSLPERTIRSLAAVATGTTNLLTETLFPEALRGTTMYRIFVGDAQKFIMEKVAEVPRQGEAGKEDEPSSDPKYVHRKIVGGALETAGLFAMHISPLWVFAIAGDAAAGSRVFLNRLVDQMKRNGVIDEQTEVTKLDDLLMAMHETSRSSTEAVDTPPLSRAEVGKLADEMMDHYSNVFSKATGLMPRLDDLWGRMEKLASRDNISLEKLEGVLTMDVTSWGKKGVGAALAVGQTGSHLFGEQILDNYSKTLDKLNEAGVTHYVSSQMKPFLDAAAGHFSSERKTWTQSLAEMVFGKSADDKISDEIAEAVTEDSAAKPENPALPNSPADETPST